MPLYRINREKLKSTVCRSTEGLQARIISVGGSGYFATGENYFEASDTNRNEFIKQLDQGYDAIAGAGDFALLKLETRGHKVPCLALTKHSLSSRQRERLTCDGFTMGVEKRVSGQIVPNSSVASEGYQVNRIDPRQEVLSLPVDHGMSGATYLDASGDIAGTIVSRMHSSLNSLARQGVTVAIGIPIEEIVRRLSIDLGSRDAARILNSCRDSRSSESRSTESKQAGEPLGV